MDARAVGVGEPEDREFAEVMRKLMVWSGW